MVDYEVIHQDGDDFGCHITIKGEHPETSEIELDNCDLKAEKLNQLVTGFERGQMVTIRLYDGNYREDKSDRSTKLVSVGGNAYGSISFGFGKLGYDAHCNHFLIDESMRGKYLGELLFTLYMGMCELEGADTVRMTVGDGASTKSWLEKMGVPGEDIEVKNGSLSVVETTLGEISYDDSNLTVIETEGDNDGDS